MHAQGDIERLRLGEPVLAPQDTECLGKLRPVEHRRAADDARGDKAQPRRGHAAREVFGEDRQPFLETVVAGKSRAEQPEPLRVPGEIGEEVDADLVAQQRVDPTARHDGVPRDQQPRRRHHQPRRHVAAQRARAGKRIPAARYARIMWCASRRTWWQPTESPVRLRRIGGDGQDPLRRVEQRRLHGAVEHARRLAKLPSPARRSS